MFQFAEVGGAVRDKFLGVESKDVDFVAIAENPENFESAEQAFAALVGFIKESGFKVFLETPQFFTVRAQVPDNHPLKQRTNVADFVLARKDGPSSDGRRPDFVLPGTLFDDLQRRDFTVNAMAILNGELIDPFGGCQDLKDKILDFVGDSRERIAEDGLRVMRALRFHITKGFDFDSFVWDELNTEFAAEMLMKVSVERIREELDKMFLLDTLSSIKLIQDLEESVQKAIFRDGLRLAPTLKK
ncbi:CCA tRNA nucleotidyltransferase [Synechococcus phage B3]|nr:CCA tRNA nucleotidyltransferase [Synechococcus phage B3]QGT54824.1 CCA tRNA nucleotidyltransferase [Synechococcus phage B23]